jgi:iron complex outermembrane receptor protein
MRRAIIASLALTTSLTAMPAFAQIAQESPGETVAGGDTVFEEQPGEDILVIGTRATARTIAESPVPVDVIGGETLSNAGYTEVNKVLGQLVPSFNFPQPSLTDGTDTLRPATLRGLSPDQTLTLVNGKRRHTSALLNLNGSVGRGSAAVDLNTIPTLAIERIEVLRDGASSLYGSDAIAGVINIELKKRPGGRATISYGKYFTHMDGVQEVTGVAAQANGQPQTDADGNYVLNTTGENRYVEDGETLTYAANIGLPVGASGYLNFTGEYRDRDPTNRSGFDPRRQYNLVGGLADPREFTFDRINHRYGDANTSDLNFFVNGGADIGDFEVYTFGSYGIRDGDGAGFYRRSTDPRNRDFAASTTASIPFYPDGFLPIITSEIEDYAAAVGVRGTVGGFSADLSYVYGHNSYQFGVIDTFNTSFGGQLSKRAFDAGGLRFGQQTINLDLQRNIEVDFASELSFAIGGEHRDENFKIVAGEFQSYAGGPFVANGAPAGAQVFPGFRPANEVDASRDSFAGYVELDAKFSDIFSIQAAGRYERFSDFGDTINGKLAARFAPVEWASIRGSISTGFRAPSLQQQFYATSSTNNVNGTLVEIGTFPVSSPVAVALGSQPLKAETALNYGGGVTFNPFRGFSLTADYYNIAIDDRIVVTENLQGAGVVALLRAAGFNDITSARFFINGIDTKTQGVDVVGSYRVPEFGYGNFTLTAGYNYNKTEIERVATLPTLPGLVLFGRQNSIQLTNGQPKTKINLGFDWDLDGFGATLRGNRYGEVQSPVATAATDFTLTPKWVVDLELRAGLPYGFDVAIGANNLLDEYPDKVPAGGAFGANGYFLPYSSFSPFGFNGRFLYARVGVDF